MIYKSVRTFNSIKAKINLAEIFNMIQTAVIIVTAILAAIAGIAACGFTGGITCIISAIATLSIWGSLSSLLAYYDAVKIGIYGLATAEGFYHLEIELPQELEQTRAIAFPSPEELPKSSGGQITSPVVANVPIHWADSLALYTSRTTQDLQSLRSLLANSEWENADSVLTLMNHNLSQLSKMEQICNAVLFAYHSYNRDTVSTLLLQDSLVAQVSAYSSASKVGIAFAQLAAAYALIDKSTGARLDTLLAIMDEAIHRLNQEASPFYQMFLDYQMKGYQAPPIITIIDYGIDEVRDGYEVFCRIKNISDVKINDISAQIESLKENIPIHIYAKTSTLLTLAPHQEAIIKWKITTPSTPQSSFLLGIAIEPLTLPGNFQGDAVQLMVSSISSLSTSQGLADENIYAYPNPFNPIVHQRVFFRFSLVEPSEITIKIYDVSNTLVSVVVDRQQMQAGEELVVSWDGKNEKGEIVANGTYFYVIESSTGKKAVGKLAVLR